MIDYSKLDRVPWGSGEIVLEHEPFTCCSKEVLEYYVYNSNKRTPLWTNIIEDLTNKGIVTE